MEAEPNDDHATATPFTAPLACNGVIGKPGDVDHFVFKATKGRSTTSTSIARRIRSPLDSVMYLGKKAAGPCWPQRRCDRLARQLLPVPAPRTTASTSSRSDQLGKGGPDYFYRIEVTPGRAPADAERRPTSQLPAAGPA